MRCSGGTHGSRRAVHPLVGRGILDAPTLHHRPGPSGMPAPTPVVVGSAVQRRDTWVPPCRPSLVGRGILDAPRAAPPGRGRQGCRPPTKVSDRFSHPLTGGGAIAAGTVSGWFPAPRPQAGAGNHGAAAAAPGIPSAAEDGLGRLGSSRRARRGCFAGCGQRVFRPVRGATGALPLDPAIWVACRPLARVVGEEFFVRARCGFAAILDVWQEAAPPPWRKRPGEHRRHTGGGQPSQEKIQ